MNPGPQHHRPRRARRWLVRIVLTLCVLLVAAIGTVQGILWSDIPRQTVSRQLAQISGCHVEVGELDIGWFGQTIARNVTVRLPLDADSFATVPQVDIVHTSLPGMLLRRGVAIASIALDSPHIQLRQDEQGDWNVLEAVALLKDRREPAGPPATTPTLPGLQITQGNILIAPYGQEPLQLPPLTVTGQPDGGVAWHGEVVFEDLVNLKSHFALGSPHAHRVELQGERLEDLITALSGHAIADPVNVHVVWDGSISQPGIAGRARLHGITIGDRHVSGAVQLVAGDGQVDATAINLDVKTGIADLPELVIAGRRITASTGQIEAVGLDVHSDEMRAMLQGRWNQNDRRGTASISWNGDVPSKSMHHRGTLNVDATLPIEGPLHATAKVESTGEIEEATYAIRSAISMSGSDWTTLAGPVTIDHAAWADPQRAINVAHAESTVSMNWPVLRIDSLEIPDITGSLIADYNADTARWSVVAAVEDYPVSISQEIIEASAVLHATGDHTSADVAQFALTTPFGTAQLAGRLDRESDIPLTAMIEIDAVPNAVRSDWPDGAVQVDGRVHGTLEPLAMQFSGSATTRDAAVDGVAIASIVVPVELAFTREKIEWIAGDSGVFDGFIQSKGFLMLADERRVEFDFAARDIDIRQFHGLLPEKYRALGHLSAEGRAEGALDAASTFRIAADWRAADVRWNDIAFDDASGHLVANKNQLRLEDITIRSGDGLVEGTADTDLEFKKVRVAARVQRWPWLWPSESEASTDPQLNTPIDAPIETSIDTLFRAQIDAQIDLAIDPTAKSAEGTAGGAATIFRNGDLLGTVRADATLAGREIKLNTVAAEIWDGTVEGHGTFALDDWTQTHAELNWTGLQIDQAGATGIAGGLSGQATITPAQEPHPLEPLKIHAVFNTNDIQFGQAVMSDGELVAYASPDRIVLQESHLNFAGGTIDAWGRVTRPDGTPLLFIDARLNDLELAQLAGISGSVPGDLPGRIDGTLSLGGPPDDLDRLFGQAEVAISGADLLNVDAVSALYSLMNLTVGKVEPDGRGQAAFRLEGRSLVMTRLAYFNHGTDIVANGRLDDIWLGTASPLTGTAIGAARPLKDINLPVFRDIDKGLQALQTKSGAIRLDGTLGQPAITPIPLPEIGAALRAVLRR